MGGGRRRSEKEERTKGGTRTCARARASDGCACVGQSHESGASSIRWWTAVPALTPSSENFSGGALSTTSSFSAQRERKMCCTGVSVVWVSPFATARRDAPDCSGRRGGGGRGLPDRQALCGRVVHLCRDKLNFFSKMV